MRRILFLVLLLAAADRAAAQVASTRDLIGGAQGESFGPLPQKTEVQDDPGRYTYDARGGLAGRGAVGARPGATFGAAIGSPLGTSIGRAIGTPVGQPR